MSAHDFFCWQHVCVALRSFINTHTAAAAAVASLATILHIENINAKNLEEMRKLCASLNPKLILIVEIPVVFMVNNK